MGVRVPTLGARMRSPGKIYKGLGSTIVPSLAMARRRDVIPTTRGVLENPFLFYPVWKLGLRIGSLGIKVASVDLPKGDQARPMRAHLRVLQRNGGLRAHDLAETLGLHAEPTHPSQNLLDAPNESLTRPMLIAGTVAHVLIYKKCAWWKERDPVTGKPIALWPIPGHSLHVVKDENKIIRRFEARSGAEVLDSWPPEDVCYFRFMPGFDDWADGLSPMDSLAKVGELGLGALQGITDLFDFGILGRIYINLNGKTLEEGDEDAAERIGLQLAKVRMNKGDVPVMEDGATIDNFGDAASDNVMHDAMDRAEHIIDRMFGLDAKDTREFYAEGVQPLADAIEHELERSYFSEWDDKVLFGEFAFREALKGSPAERIEMHQKAIFSMQETPDEARIDEGREPQGGPAAELWGPLNLWQLGALAASQNRAEPSGAGADSKGGLGGAQGKGSLLSLPSGKQVGMDPTPDAPRGLGTTGRSLRARQSNGRPSRFARPWRMRRDRIVSSHAEALGRRARSLIKSESKAIRSHLEVPNLRAQGDRGLPALQELTGALGMNDREFLALVMQFMAQAGEDAWAAAQELIDAVRTDVSVALRDAYLQRAQVVMERFGLARSERLVSLFEQAVEQGWRSRDLAEAISAEWDSLAVHFVDGVARTEVAYALEHASVAAWRQSGVLSVDFVFGGGPCTTGVCEDVSLGGPYDIGSPLDNVGYSFDDANSPPLHPSCTCFMVPSIDAEILAASGL